jgi:hypothetical protein
MKSLIVLVMLWTNPNGSDGHLVLKADYTSLNDCVVGADHAYKRSDLLDSHPDDLSFACFNKADVDPSWFLSPSPE